MKKTPVKQIESRIELIRSKAGAGWVTNYFGQPLVSSDPYFAAGDKALVFLDSDSDFSHLYFFSADPDELRKLLVHIPQEPVVLDYLTKAPDERLMALFSEIGFCTRATYHRLSGVLPKTYAVRKPTVYAHEDDAPALHERMPRDLDRFCDHFPSLEGLRRMISNKQVLVCSVDGTIAGYFIYQITGVRSHLNYWFTEKRIDPASSIDLLLRCYVDLATKGVKYVYAWVDRENIKVLRIHERFGLHFDGLFDFILERGVHEKHT